MIVSERVAAPFEPGGELRARADVRRPSGGRRRRARQPRSDRARGPARPGARARAGVLRAALDGLRDIPIVGDVRGAATSRASSWSPIRRPSEPFEPAAAAEVVAFLRRVKRRGLICRAADRGYPVIQLAPPLIAGPGDFEEIAADPARRAEPPSAARMEQPGDGAVQPAPRPARARRPARRRPGRAAGLAWSTSPAGSGSTRARRRARCARCRAWPRRARSRPRARTGSGRGCSPTRRSSPSAGSCAPPRRSSSGSWPRWASART